MDSTITEILKPSTLKYMQNVHWTNPDCETNRGLGFSVRKGSDGKKIVGHGGSCPGYRSTLSLMPDSKMAYIVMINASGTDPNKYAGGIQAILHKAKGPNQKQSEKYAMVGFPTDSPADAMTLFKHIEGDIFRWIRDDGKLGETLVFERNESGQITRLKSHGNYSTKMIR